MSSQDRHASQCDRRVNRLSVLTQEVSKGFARISKQTEGVKKWGEKEREGGLIL